jgi:parallel beta-helix repeat protein
MNTKATILTLTGVLVFCGTAEAKKLHVPGQYATIQAGIDAAVDGDEVIVADGTYTGEGNRDIDFLGKAITVRSENGPENCIIDCNGTEAERHRGFRFGNNEDANSVVDGFTIINGYAPDEPFRDDWPSIGGAIFCSSSSPMVNNCVVTGNTARLGAGIYCEDSTATFNNCTVSMNHGTGFLGGRGIMCFGSNSTISNCKVNGNEGGGIHFGGGNPVITNCTVNYNKGRGISCGESNPTIANCTISFNKGEEYGGGISLSFSNGTVTDCNISNNTNPEWEVGGIYLWDSSATIARCTITGNSTFFGAGGIYCEEYSKATINDCVIKGNYTQFGAAGIDCERSDAAITNCIISSNFGWGVRIDTYSGAIISGCTISMNEETAISGSYSNATIMNCIISGNSGYLAGGITWYRGRGTTTIANCTISGNSGKYTGGIYAAERSSVRIDNCTINDNKTERNGGGVCCEHDSNTVLTNCILWGNTASQGNQIAVGMPDDPDESTLTITYSDVQGGENDAYVKPGCELNWGIGNIDADPWLVEPGFWDANGTPQDANDDFWIEGNYHLLEGSPCIDTGDPNYTPEPNETDLDGNPRIVNDRIDMGAYEYIPPVEVAVHLTPQTLNCRSKGKYIKAHITLPEGFLAEDVDVNEPAIAEPVGLESEYIKGLGADKIEIAFDRQDFCDALTEDGELEVTVTGSLTTGQYFSATDTITIIGRH